MVSTVWMREPLEVAVAVGNCSVTPLRTVGFRYAHPTCRLPAEDRSRSRRDASLRIRQPDRRLSLTGP
jgi:hypothetical protein